ncbi:MAG: hypothetical protein AAF560_23710 [Acidobacteriota bacterium]
MITRLESRRVTVLASAALLLSATLATPLAARTYTDAELEVMPAPGPNPFLSFLPVGAEVNWDYWNAWRDYQGRKRAEAQAAARGETRFGTVAEVEPNDTFGTAQAIPAFGTGTGDNPSIDITGTVGSGDVDCFRITLEVGDIIGFVRPGGGLVEMFNPSNDLQMGTTQDGSGLYPAASPMPGGGATGDHITYVNGDHVICTQNGAGSYTLQLRAFRSVFEDQGTQVLFIDFDGAMIDPAIFGGPPGVVSLSPLSDFLAGWGLGPADENAVIDSILASVDESITADLAMQSNPSFGVEILNSRDHADPFGQPNVSRLIVGGTIGEFGIGTIGIAESIDPGNFGTEESAVILLDLLSDPGGGPNSLNQFGLGGGATQIDLVGTGVGNIVVHEAGHYLGNWHTEQFSAMSDPSIMDQGGNLPGTVGVGPDNTFGTGDDFDVDLSVDLFNFAEGFTGTEHTNEKSAHALTTGSLFVDSFETGDTTRWSNTTP